MNQQNILDSLIEYLPHSFLLSGEVGSEQETICDEICRLKNIEKYNMDKIDLSAIDTLNSLTYDVLCVIDCFNISEREQNVILKFLEEPLSQVYICLICDDEFKLLNTIRNRCMVYRLNKYSVNQLKEYTDNDLIINIAKTPGQVKSCAGIDVKKLYEMADKIIDNIKVAAIPNALTLTDKIFEIDNSFEIFTKIILFLLSNRYRSTGRGDLLVMYKEFSKFLSELSIKNIDKKKLLDKCILDIKIRL